MLSRFGKVSNLRKPFEAFGKNRLFCCDVETKCIKDILNDIKQTVKCFT